MRVKITWRFNSPAICDVDRQPTRGKTSERDLWCVIASSLSVKERGMSHDFFLFFETQISVIHFPLPG